MLPKVNFKVRVGDTYDDGGCGFDEGSWTTKTTDDFFKGKKVVVFSLPGAFTPTCSTYQLPGFETNYNKIKEMGVDEVYCISVNDAFVMNKWAKDQCVERVKVIPDGNALFTQMMGMLVDKRHLGFGQRSWRYAAVINDGVVEAWFEEPGKNNSSDDDDPFEVSDVDTMINYLKENAG